MKKLDRRKFLALSGFVITAGVIGWNYGKTAGSSILLDKTSSFYAAFLTDELIPGTALRLVWQNKLACILYNDFMLGFLPTSLQKRVEKSKSVKVQIDQIGVGQDDRIKVYVVIR
jgi:hypothetical protein